MIQSPFCECCGQPIKAAQVCFRCRQARPRYSALRSWAIFGGSLRQAVHRLKYKRDVGLGEVLSRPMTQVLQSQQWKIDLVCPVPLGVARLAERGFNQAALLARPIALSSGLIYSPHAVHREKETLSQVGLNFERRHHNVSGAFQANPAVTSGKNVLIVDDVATSGATLEACAQALLEAGATQVYALTLARAALEQA